MGREIRRVPLDWEHPVDPAPPSHWGPSKWDWTGQGRHFVPLYDKSLGDARAEWDREKAEWDRGEHEHQHFLLIYHTPGRWSRDQDSETWVKNDEGSEPEPYKRYAEDGETVLEERWLRDMADLLALEPYEEYAGERPKEGDGYRPDWGDRELAYQFYETVSEGTPLSPPFATLGELADFLVEKLGYDRRVAESFCGVGWAPSFVVTESGRLLSDIESTTLVGHS